MIAPKTHTILIAVRKYGNYFLYLPSIFGNAGIKTHVLAPDTHPLRKSKCAEKLHLVPDDDDAYADKLVQLLKSGAYERLVIGDDPALQIMLAHRADPELAAYLPYPVDNGIPEAALGKREFYQFCKANDIAIPTTTTVASLTEAEKVAESLGFPVVLKGSKGMGGQAVRMIHNLEELRDQYHEIESFGATMVQQYLGGKLGSSMVLAKDGEIRAWCSAGKTVCIGDGTAPSCVRTLSCGPAHYEFCRKMAKATNLNGFIGFDWIEEPDGKIYTIDFHGGRSIACMTMPIFAGEDLGRAYRRMLDDEPVSWNVSAEPRVVAMNPQVIDFLLDSWFFDRLHTLLKVANPFSRQTYLMLYPKGDFNVMVDECWAHLASFARIRLAGLRRSLSARLRHARVKPATTVIVADA